MRNRFLLIALALLAAACTELPEAPYADALLALEVQLDFPSTADGDRSGIPVRIEETSSLNSYIAPTDADGCARFRVGRGVYRISVSHRDAEGIYNGMADRVRLTDGDQHVALSLFFARAGSLVIKEIYTGGCSCAPEQGTHQADKYFIIHNNAPETMFLDGLCFGTLDPYNSNAPSGNVWADAATGEFRPYAPVVDAVWRFPGSGETFPLAPGEDAVVVLNGAVDHTQQYPLSVDLNRDGYFVCYDPVLFPNATYHPTPGDRIAVSHYIELAVKVGISNAYTMSINSPTLILFRAPEGTDMDAYLSDTAQSTVTKPGAQTLCVKIPWEWIVDGVEVYNGSSSNNAKRLRSDVDAGFVYLSRSFMGHTLHRLLDEEASAAAGYDIYCDTNNSTADFYERDTQSLHE